MKVYKLLNLSNGEDVAIYVEGVYTLVVFPSITAAIEHRNVICDLVPDRLLSVYFDVVEIELPEEGVQYISWTKD